MKLLLPSLILTGCMGGFVSSSISHLLPIPPRGQNNDNSLGIVLVFVGIGNVIGGYLSGFIADRKGIKFSSYIAHSSMLLATILYFLYSLCHKTVWGSCTIGLAVGFSFSSLFSLITLMCTTYFKGSA